MTLTPSHIFGDCGTGGLVTMVRGRVGDYGTGGVGGCSTGRGVGDCGTGRGVGDLPSQKLKSSQDCSCDFWVTGSHPPSYPQV